MTKELLLEIIREENSRMSWNPKWKAWRLTGAYKGFDWIIHRLVRSQEFNLEDENSPIYLCGYIKIPKGHPLYRINVCILNELYNFDVHGGLIYSGNDRTDNREEWWLGFNCGHAHDIATFSGPMGVRPENEYRNLDYVIENIKSLTKEM